MSDENKMLWGAGEIAKVIGRPVRATFHLLEKGEIPAKKVGGRWVAHRDKLVSYLTGDEAA